MKMKYRTQNSDHCITVPFWLYYFTRLCGAQGMKERLKFRHQRHQQTFNTALEFDFTHM